MRTQRKQRTWLRLSVAAMALALLAAACAADTGAEDADAALAAAQSARGEASTALADAAAAAAAADAALAAAEAAQAAADLAQATATGNAADVAAAEAALAEAQAAAEDARAQAAAAEDEAQQARDAAAAAEEQAAAAAAAPTAAPDPPPPPPADAGPSAIRLAILSDCEGAFGAFHDRDVAGVVTAFAEHAGATVNDRNDPQAGFSNASINGVPIELVGIGCADDTAEAALRETRRLMEDLGAHIMIGPLSGDESIAVANYAKDHPNQTFVN